MAVCSKCGTATNNQNALCDNCQKNQVSNVPNALESMGIFKDEPNMDWLFARMENSGVQTVSTDVQWQNQQSQAKKQKVYLEQQNSKSDNYLLGFMGSLVGALIGAIPWALVASKGWFVGWLGYLIAIASSKGYDFMKVKLNTKKLWCMAVSIIISVFAAQILSDIIFIATDFELQNDFDLIFDYYKNNFDKYLSVNMPNLIMGYVFAALGAFGAFKEIKEEAARLEYLRNQMNGGAQ